MTLFDFFAASELPAPAMTQAGAASVALDRFGVEVSAHPLGSQQDANFLLHDPTGHPVGVLKVANPAFSLLELQAQHEAARHIADGSPQLRTATTLDMPGHRQIAEIPGDSGVLYARIIRYLSGGTLSGTHYLSATRIAGLGTVSGLAVRALADFTHPGVDRILQWDLRHADRTVELLAPYVRDVGRREAVETAVAEAWQTVTLLSDDLRRQVIHCDITDDNVVCGVDGIPDGIIDFGDLTNSWAVAELAITLSSVLRHEGGEPAAARPALVAFHRVWPLTDAEITALWPLVVLRAATLVVSGHQQAAIDGDNSYVTDALEWEWLIFERATSVPSDVMTALFRSVLGVASSDRDHAEPGAPLLGALDPAAVALLDLSVEADGLDDGVWTSSDCENRLARALLDDGAVAVTTDFGSARLSRSVPLSPESPATVATGVDVWLAGTHRVEAPLAGTIVAEGPTEVAVRTAMGTVRVQGDSLAVGTDLRVGAVVLCGDELGTATIGRLWIQVSTRSEEVPAFVRSEYAPGWLAQVRDPRTLLGLATGGGAAETPAALLGRRAAAFANVQEMYYSAPPRIERGWREFLVATDGRSYLDMVNNVAVAGHGHPALAEAAARQWRRLNTNSRFNYASVATFSERLAALLPDPLDTVFLVNSGSEAVDLALRLAFAATGRSTVVAVREAYHGWTYATDAISTSVADNPNALSTRPNWVTTVPSPNSYRGDHRGEHAARYGPEAVDIIEQLAAQGSPPAAFICEPFYGNAGGVELPAGYLDQVYSAVRGVGGVTIADEVQVGYGRLGRWFWGFQQQQVVPDIVTVAKAMGNGQPLGAVITTKAIAEAYRSQGYFFSSAGGSPVSSVVGLTVLDIIEREKLQDNALRVGEHLRTRLTALADRHPIIGAVHGSGLYMGVELVRDRETLEPAVTETAAICERMRELGVVVQPTGDHNCVLKMKPPMCISLSSADFFVDALDRVLTTGW
ncbi:MAG: aminotransferase [Mycobacterium sp.]